GAASHGSDQGRAREMKGTQIMNTSMKRFGLVALVLALSSSVAFGFRGGGFRGGGFGGFHAGGVGGFRGGEFGGFHEGGFDRGSWSGARSFSGWSGARGSAGTESY